jgi:Uma2 family endonuclease
MSTASESDAESLGDLVHRLGDIPLYRIRLKPPLGTARERDVIAALDRQNRPCELVDGTLVEKAMGFAESIVSGEIFARVRDFVRQHDLGLATPADGTVRLSRGLIRIPDVAFFAWSKFPGRTIPTRPVPDLIPDLAVEVLSAGNTKGEMDRKLREYFLAGVRLVWLVDPAKRSARAFTDPGTSRRVGEARALDGGDLLPGFTLPLRDLFALLAPPPGPRRKPKAG